MVFYRKYRPQTLSELIGQQTAKNALEKAIISSRLSHAYLFCGPRGTGKTSTARILAKAVNCEKFGAKDVEIPCNECKTCISITDGSNLDLIEIDAASNRGIDDIRALREKIKLAPTQARKKVYIIDEVHMLTTEAFNALLKTLEEPPEHVLFILATTDPQKIPATILSRVQRIDFQLATEEELLLALERITEKEKLEVEKDALLLIAKRSEGSFRDCLKLLDQLASSGEKITTSIVENHFKSGTFESIETLLEALAQKDGSKAIEHIQTEVSSGTNVKEYISSLLEVLRTLLLLKNNALKTTAVDPKRKVQLQKLADSFSSNQVIALIDSLFEALEKMKTTSIISLPLEVAILENCEMNNNSIHVSTVTQTTVAVQKESPLKEEKGDDNETIETIASMSETVITDNASSVADLSKIHDKWQFILETIKPFNYSLEALLRQVKILNCEDGIVSIEVPYSFHQRILEAPKSKTLLESVLSDVLGKSARIACVLGAKPVRVEEISNIEIAADDDIIRVAAEIFNSDAV